MRELIDEPLLVTMPVNVFYLTGLRSSNAALLVDRERARLFSDFRYAEAGRKVEGVEFVEVERALIRGLAAHVDGRLVFERSHLTYANWEVLRDAGLDLVPGGGQVERLRAVKTEDELDLIRRATDITNQAYVRLAEERFVGRTERELAFRFADVPARARRGRRGVSDDRRLRTERRDAARRDERPRRREGRDGRRRRRRACSRATRPTARARSPRARCRTSSGGRTTSCSRRSSRASTRSCRA